MDYAKHLREERVAAYEKAKEILDRAGSESRNLDAEERQSVDRAFAHMDELKAREMTSAAFKNASRRLKRRPRLTLRLAPYRLPPWKHPLTTMN